MQLGYFQGSHIECRVISTLRTLVFETAIRVPHDQVEDKKRIGEVTRMYEQETYMIGVAVAQVQTFLGRVLLLALEVYILARVFDSSRFVVLAIFATLCAVYLLGELLINYARGKWHEKSAARLNLVHECFKGIRMIKFNAWEKKIRIKMEHARTEKNWSQKTYGFLTAALLAFDKNSTHVFSAVFFVAITAQSSSFTPAQVFTALILVDRIKNRIFGLTRLSASTISGIISFQNIDSYLRENRSEPQQATTIEINPRDPSTAVAITRACLTESSSNSEPHKTLLASVNLIIRRGHLTVIHGRTGTGKSTLLRAMLKEVRPLYGDVFVTSDCRIAYCPQEPWLQTLSIRENILFGSAFNELKYRCVLDACCLLGDLKMLPDGDATRVGPKDVNLSGGQKGWIALARACYADADLYVLDCPFAIVQSDVFRKCLVDLLRFKTVVLVTYSPEMISSEFVDQVVTISDASVIDPDAEESGLPDLSLKLLLPTFLHRDFCIPIGVSIIAIVACGVVSLAKDLWLVSWISGGDSSTVGVNATVYGSLVVITLATSVFGGVMGSLAFINATNGLVDTMTWSLLRAPMAFFYSTPVGEILKCYSRDIDLVDNVLSVSAWLLFQHVTTLSFQVTVIWYFMGFTGIFVVVIVVFVLKRMFPARDFLRLEGSGLHESKRLNFISEALDGAAVIRAFGPSQVERFRFEHGENSDTATRRTYFGECFNTSVIVRFTHIYGILLAFLGLLLWKTQFPPAVLGLLLHYVFMIEGNIMGVAIGFINSLVSMSSVQRICEYSLIERESTAHTLQTIQPPAGWPQAGHIIFDEVNFSYSSEPDGIATLRNLSFTVAGAQKIGVIGRTGSGKSSLAMALFQLHSLTRGRIQIDGVDTSRLDLDVLRSSICIIPQTPMFYRCSVRHYLDPFDEFNDRELWSCVHKCGLRTSVNSLEAELWDNGENWSLGERQMLCLTRALLKPSRLLLLDEPFSALDQANEARLLGVLEESFAHSTVFLITHCLDQVLKFDKIMVLEKGELVEFGPAEELASDPSSGFYEFLETTLLTF